MSTYIAKNRPCKVIRETLSDNIYETHRGTIVSATTIYSAPSRDKAQEHILHLGKCANEAKGIEILRRTKNALSTTSYTYPRIFRFRIVTNTFNEKTLEGKTLTWREGEDS